MNKKTLAWLCIAAALIGCAAGWWANRDPIIPALETKHTDEIAGEIKDTVETVTARIKEQDTRMKTEVRVIRETVRTKVNALPPDDVVDGLNAELSLFRGLEAGTGGLDGG